jgi:hypothetical protein
MQQPQADRIVFHGRARPLFHNIFWTPLRRHPCAFVLPPCWSLP